MSQNIKIVLRSGFLINLQLPVILEAETYHEASSFVDDLRNYESNVIIVNGTQSIYLEPTEIAAIICSN